MKLKSSGNVMMGTVIIIVADRKVSKDVYTLVPGTVHMKDNADILEL